MDIETLNVLMQKFDGEVSKFMNDFRHNFKDDKNLGEVIIQINSPIASDDKCDPTTWTATIALNQYRIEFKKAHLAHLTASEEQGGCTESG